MASIVAAVIFIVIGILCGLLTFWALLTEADAQNFGQTANQGPIITLGALGTAASFGLAAWLIFS